MPSIIELSAAGRRVVGAEVEGAAKVIGVGHGYGRRVGQFGRNAMIFSGGMGTCDKSAWLAILKLLSGWSGGTCRSSPQKTCMSCQQICSAKAGRAATHRGCAASAADRAIVQAPFAATEARARSTMPVAAVCRRSSMVREIRICAPV